MSNEEGEFKKRIWQVAEERKSFNANPYYEIPYSAIVDVLDEARKDFYDMLKAFPTIKPEIEPVIKKWFGSGV